jgi:hypothetical protein
MELNRFKTDQALEQEGVWIDLGEGASIRVARAGNRRNSELFNKLTSDPEYQRKDKLDTLTEADLEAVVVTCLAETILLDWKGFEDGGKEVPFSKEKAREMLAYRDFRNTVQEASRDAANFRARSVKEATEALKKSSLGN